MMEERTRRFRGGIKQVLAESNVTDRDASPSISLSMDDRLEGDISVLAVLNKESRKKIVPLLVKSGLQRDVLLVNCKGNYSYNKNDIELSCTMINEDGIPVSRTGKENILDTSINKMRERIVQKFFDS
jgi:hypothetical protein